MNIHKTKTFRFQSYLLKMFLSLKKDDIQLPEMVLIDEMYRDYTKFMNFLILEIYASIFQKRLPRVLPDMWDLLQASTEKRIGDWFLTEYGTMIKLYGFTQSPYMLPAFLTPIFFLMELIRQNLFIEIEQFLKYKMSNDIKYLGV